MSLFDARANLYDEATAQQAASTYKPVQKNRIVESIDPTMLEMAETVATEHFYQRAGAGRQAGTTAVTAEPALAETTASMAMDAEQSSRPDIDLSGGSSAGYPVYRPSESIASDLEFGRTMATESTLGATGVDMSARASAEAPYRDEFTAVPDIYPASESLPLDKADQTERKRLAAEEIRQLKRQSVSDRERRALAMEPVRELDENQRRQIEEFSARNAVAGQSAIDDRDLALRPESRVAERAKKRDEKLEEYAFIPDDVLKNPPVYKDDGRREGMRFDSETPQFDTALNDRREERDLNRQPVRSRDDRRAVPLDRSRPEREAARETPGADDAPGRRRESRDSYVSDSSAQEMRRYQQHRPAVEVSEFIEEPILERAPRTKNRRSGLSPWLIACALIAAVCLALYTARNVIANMSLPEPLIASFCQVTGCVPAEAKIDTSQLQTMRQRLYPHPDIADALVISIDLVNNSIYKQPYPAVSVTLLNAEGGAVAERRFETADYEVVDRSNSGFLMPEEPTRITIEVVDTGLGATDVALEFE